MSTVGYISLYPFDAPGKSSQNNPSSVVLNKLFFSMLRISQHIKPRHLGMFLNFAVGMFGFLGRFGG
jgi:hypothetical protein